MASESELNIKLERVQELLDQANLDALFLRRVNNFAWLTCGASSYVNIADTLGNASLLITPANRYVITDNIEASRLAQEEGLIEQGWEFRVLPWHEVPGRIYDLTRGLKLGADTDFSSAAQLNEELTRLRVSLTREEEERFRILGRLCASGMQQAVDAVYPGMSEFEIAGLLSQAVESRGVQVVVNLIAVDERIFSYRHPLPTSRKLQRYAMLILCGRKWGLICSLTRLIHFGPLPEEVRCKEEAVAQIDATMIAATRPGCTIGDVFREAQAAYALAGFPDEWKNHHQGGLAGYMPREIVATPESIQPILLGQAYAWNPSITGVKSEDTVLVGEQNNEIITEMDGWPMINVQIDDQTIKRPAILEREPL